MDLNLPKKLFSFPIVLDVIIIQKVIMFKKTLAKTLNQGQILNFNFRIIRIGELRPVYNGNVEEDFNVRSQTP